MEKIIETGKAAAEKKAYSSPSVAVMGRIADITWGASGPNADGMSAMGMA